MKAVRASNVFWIGITLSLVFNSGIIAFLFSHHGIANKSFWQATTTVSLIIFLFAAVPVFGAMAMVSWGVQRQTTRKFATRWLVKSWLVCFLICCISGTLVFAAFAPQSKFSTVQYLLSLEVAFVSLMLCLVILLNLSLRYLGLQQDRLAPDDSQAD